MTEKFLPYGPERERPVDDFFTRPERSEVPKNTRDRLAEVLGENPIETEVDLLDAKLDREYPAEEAGTYLEELRELARMNDTTITIRGKHISIPNTLEFSPETELLEDCISNLKQWGYSVTMTRPKASKAA